MEGSRSQGMALAVAGEDFFFFPIWCVLEDPLEGIPWVGEGRNGVFSLLATDEGTSIPRVTLLPTLC